MEAERVSLSRLDGSWRSVVARFGDPVVAEAQGLHRSTYEQLGFIAEPQILNEEGLLLDEWSASSWHVGLSFEDRVVAHLRLIEPTFGPLQSQGWWPSLDIPDNSWEVSALVVDRSFGRPFDIARRLYREAFHFAATTSCPGWVCAVELGLARILGRWFPMHQIGEARDLYGSPNVALYVSFDDVFAGLREGTVDQSFWPPIDANGNCVWTLDERSAPILTGATS